MLVTDRGSEVEKEGASVSRHWGGGGGGLPRRRGASVSRLALAPVLLSIIGQGGHSQRHPSWNRYRKAKAKVLALWEVFIAAPPPL